MRISSLKLFNFMGYRGEYTIDFRVAQSAPVILFLGENGHGKSSIQHAARWCLYGSTEEKGKEIPREMLVNRKSLMEDPEAPMSVTLVWISHGKEYELQRQVLWETGGRCLATATLRIDGANPVPHSAIPEYVQRFLAKAISHFVFFNGEVQAEFDDMATSSGSADFVRQEIEKTLSIPVIQECIEFLAGRASDESTAIMKANKNNKKVADAQKKRFEATELMAKFQEEFNKAVGRRNEAKFKIQEIEGRLGNLEAAQRLMSEISTLRELHRSQKDAAERQQDAVRDYLSTNPWLSLAPRLIQSRKELEGKLSDANLMAASRQRLQIELEQLEILHDSGECPLCHSNADSTGRGLDQRITQVRSSLQALGESDTTEIERQLRLFDEIGLDESIYVSARSAQKSLNRANADLVKTGMRLKELEDNLSLYGDVDIQDELTALRAETENEISHARAIEAYRKDIEVQKSVIAQCDHQVAKAKGVSPERQRTLASYEYLTRLLKETLEIYVGQVREQVQTFASETFMQMISDPKYQGLRINENYGVDLVMKDGLPDPLRSTGQGKIATIALVSGLIKTAMSEGSILMDTPFVSLDEGHRRQVCRWAYESGLWVSLFMHSGEFNKEDHLDFFDGRVGRIYRIQQVDINESVIFEEI